MKKELTREEFKSYLLERHNEYKTNPQIKQTAIISSLEKGIRLLLDLCDASKIIPYLIIEKDFSYSFLEINKELIDNETWITLQKLSRFLSETEKQLGYLPKNA